MFAALSTVPTRPAAAAQGPTLGGQSWTMYSCVWIISLAKVLLLSMLFIAESQVHPECVAAGSHPQQGPHEGGTGTSLSVGLLDTADHQGVPGQCLP